LLTIQAWLNSLKQRSFIQSGPNPTSTNDLYRLIQHLLQKNRAWIFAHPEHLLSDSEINQLADWLIALQTGKPLAYITGKQMFWDLDLVVDSHTLIPRPDTEILIETAIELLTNNPPARILDLGTGSGALALVLAKVFPGAEVLAVDCSIDALTVAKHNAKLHQIQNIQFQQSNWFDQLSSVEYDLIVSNPPYIAADDEHLDMLTHEPITALVADENGLGDYLRITAVAKDYLKTGGLLMFEHGWQQKHPLHDILLKAGLQNIDSRHDLAGHDRITFAYKL
jgi:release factor glutamine methyltransferase